MNDAEREAIILNAAWEMIDGMVNWSIFARPADAAPTNLLFRSESDARLFIILLRDFLSVIGAKDKVVPFELKRPPTSTSTANLTFLFHLRVICRNPILGSNPEPLLAAAEAFATWLESDFTAERVNLYTISIVVDLKMERCQCLQMCGDIAKHNLGRLTWIVGKLHALLKQEGYPVEISDAYLAVAPFFEWCQQQVLLRHVTSLAAFLNNIAWAIHDYLGPEYQRSFKCDGPARHPAWYGFANHADITDPIAMAMRWDVLNRVRRKPYLPRFSVSAGLAQGY